MIDWVLLIFVAIGLFLFYLGWVLSYSTWERLAGLGIAHNRSSSSYFDAVLYSGLAGLLISRVSWMFMHNNTYLDVPWGILPYSRSATEFAWFTTFPWRLFRLNEGVIFPILWAIMGILIVLFLFVPTISMARKLKLEKRGIMRAFIIRSIVGIIATLAYFGTLVYFSL